MLAKHPASRAELRVRLQARELLHEHLALYTELASEYRINLSREIRYDPNRPNVSRRHMVSFADTILTLRIAVDLKTELFRNATKPWTMNPIYDIDALSMAIPYCHVVVPDREMADLLSRSDTGPRHGTKIITTLSDLPNALPELAEQARHVPGDRTGWDWATSDSACACERGSLIDRAAASASAVSHRTRSGAVSAAARMTAARAYAF